MARRTARTAPVAPSVTRSHELGYYGPAAIAAAVRDLNAGRVERALFAIVDPTSVPDAEARPALFVSLAVERLPDSTIGDAWRWGDLVNGPHGVGSCMAAHGDPVDAAALITARMESTVSELRRVHGRALTYYRQPVEGVRA